MSKELSNLLFPHVGAPPKLVRRKTPAFRIAPSPTGSLHLGSIAMGFVNRLLADAHKGVFFLRIEDTDKKREVEGGVEALIAGFEKFGIKFDEFAGKQSERLELYHAFAKQLVEKGHAYPCFCDPTPGYKGEGCSNISLEQVKKNLDNNKSWCLRFRSTAKEDERIHWDDLIRGKMSLPAQENHFVLLKSDGIPPYNFAHVVDDTTMGTTHVVRGEEWLPSTAEHIQIHRALFGTALNYEYAHLPVITVLDEGNKRKLSKRKDKFALGDWFLEQGYPVASVKEYILTLFNTDYEMWRIANPSLPFSDFEFKFERIGNNSPLFDMQKLEYISREVISRMTKREIHQAVVNFGITEEKILQALEIDRETEKPRKDIAKWSEIPEMFNYMITAPKIVLSEDERAMLKQYKYKTHPTREEWFADIKSYGFKVRDFTQAIRKALTGRENTPDLFAIKNILGEAEVTARLGALFTKTAK